MAAEEDIVTDVETLLVYYEAQEPEYATEEKVHKVIRSFKKKAKKIEGADWREMMYAAFTEQRGIDPREHYRAAFAESVSENGISRPSSLSSVGVSRAAPLSDEIGVSRPGSISGDIDVSRPGSISGDIGVSRPGSFSGDVGVSRPASLSSQAIGESRPASLSSDDEASRRASLSLSVAESPPKIGQSYQADATGLDESVDAVMHKIDAELDGSLESAPALSPAVSFEPTPSAGPTPGGALSRLDRLELSAYSPGMTPDALKSAGTRGEPTPPPAVHRTQSEEELEEEMAGIREEYLMDLFTNCQTCLDPISGEKLLVADLSYTIRMLSVMERYNLRSENELANDIEDNLIFERRSATSLETKTIVGADGSAELFARDAEDVSKDGSTILLTEKEKFKRVCILGAPACGKTTLLQKMRYWAALKAYEDPDEDLPVFVALASFAVFVDAELKTSGGDEISLMAYLKATCSDENFRMLEYYHRRGKLLMLCDGLDESAHVKELVQQYLARDLTEEAARVVISSRLAGFSDEFLSDHDFQFVQLELCTADVQKLTAKRRMSESDFERFCALLVEQPMLSAYATTPLTLSLLIQLFKRNQLVSEEELAMYGMVMNRGALYEAGCLHMLDMSERRQQRIAAGSKEKFPTLDTELDGEVWRFLEELAMDLHVRGTRDFMIADIQRLGAMSLWERLEPYLLNYMIPILMRLEVDLTTASIRRTSMSEPVEHVASARQRKSADDAIRYQWRFIHLTFQEFFTARSMITTLKTEMAAKKFYTSSNAVFRSLLSDKLYDAWYREALLLLASSADVAMFSDLIDFLLADADGSQSAGVNDHLVVVMLEERREHPKYEAKRAAVRKAQEARLFKSVLAAMSHPYEVLRREAAEQLYSLDMSIGNIAKQMSKELSGSKSDWFAIVAMMESLIDIRSMYETDDGGDEAGVVGDGKHDTALAEVIAKTLLNHDDLDVVRAAARGIGAIGVSTNAVMFGLLDKLDNGHRYVLQDVSIALLKLGMGWSEITQQIMMRCNRPVLRASTTQIDDDTPNAEWLAVAEALGSVLPSEEAKLAAIPELDRVLNHADVEVSVAGARSLGKLGGGMKVITFCKDWLQKDQQLEDRLSALKALRALGRVQLELTTKGSDWEHTPRTATALERERPMVLDMFVELLRDGDPAIRAAAASALLACISEDDAWTDAVEHLVSIPLEAQGVEQLVEGSAALAMVHPKGANDELVMKLTEVMDHAEWRLSKSAAGTLVALVPDNADIIRGLLNWVTGGFFVQQLEAIQLLGKAKCPELLDEVVQTLLKLVEDTTGGEQSALAVAAVDALAQLGQSSESIVTKFIDIILAGDAADAATDDVPLQAAALNAIALMDDPPKQLSSLVNRVLLSSEGLSYMLWEPCAKALRAMVDKEVAKEKAALVASGRGDKVEMQFELQRADEERALLSQASQALFAHNTNGKGGHMSVDASGRQVIGLSGRRMIHKMHPAIEIALETLEGNLLVMRRADKMEAAAAAANAIEALAEPSDVLAAWLLDRITTVPAAAAGLATCIGIRNPEVLRVLLKKIGAPNFEERRRALEVVNQLEITQDFQAYVALMVVSEEPTTGYLCKALHSYFQRCLQRNPRWKLCEPLHMTLLRQQKANPKCIDFGFLLKELRVSGALTHVDLTPESGRRGSMSVRSILTPSKGK